MKVIRSSSNDVYCNLAIEDALLDDPSIEPPVLFLYRNAGAVVLGKNQNPWQECNVPELEKLGIRLARRVTGGGTVFHDPGNLNVSMILPRDRYSRSDALEWMMGGLRMFKLEPKVVNDTSIVVSGKKVSGNAFCFRRERVLHHGTLLWNADLDVLRSVLKPALNGIETRAIPSVPMPVHNLEDLLPGITIDELEQTVVNAIGLCTGETLEAADYEPSDLDERMQKMQSWEWVYGGTPDFMWADDSVVYDVHRGVIRGIRGASRSLVGSKFAPSP